MKQRNLHHVVRVDLISNAQFPVADGMPMSFADAEALARAHNNERQDDYSDIFCVKLDGVIVARPGLQEVS